MRWRERVKSLIEWRWFAAINSVIVLGLVIFVLSRRVGFNDLDEILARLRVEWLLAAIPLGFLTLVAAALRTRDIYSREAEQQLAFLPTYRLLLVGQFMAYASPIALAADIARVGLFRLRFGLHFDVSARATLFDRIVGALGLIVIGIPTSFLQPILIEQRSLALFQAVLFGGACVLVGAVLIIACFAQPIYWRPARAAFIWVKRLGEHFKHPDFIVKQSFFAALLVGFACATFWMVAKALALDLPLLSILAFTPLILFINGLPFLYAGWGGRELITVATLSGAMHVPSDQALLVSIGYGLVTLIVAMAGAAFWLARPTFRKGSRAATVVSGVRTTS